LAKAFFFPIIQFPENLFFPILSVSFFQIFYSIALQYFRFIENPPMYGFFSICFSVLKNGLSVGFLYLLDLKLDGLIYSSLLSGLFFFLFSLVIFQINGLISFKFDFKSALDCLRLGLPLLLHQLGTWLASSSIKLVISTLLGVAITGSFSISLTISLAILFIQDSFNKAFMPYLFEKLKDPDFHKIFETKIIKLTYLVNLILLLISIAYGIFSYFVIDLIFGVKYLIAKDVIILLSISYAFEGMYKMHVNYLFFKNRTDLVFVITLTSGILNILLSYFLIREFGIIGAGMSLLVSNIYSYLICWYLSNRVFPMNWLSFSKWL
jgi:O-antigen/teichoic acid export membrane protein